MTDDEREFVDRFGLFMEMAGSSRTAGRLFGWLLICRQPDQSLTELADQLEVSKAAVSNVIRQMQQAGFVERVPDPDSRQHRYQLREEGWLQIAQSRVSFLSTGKELSRDGLKVIGDDPERAGRLTEFATFLEFMEQEYGDALVRRWERYRDGEGS